MINAQMRTRKLNVKKCSGMSYFRLGTQKGLSEELAFEMNLELYEGTKANILKENGFGRFQEQQETQGG